MSTVQTGKPTQQLAQATQTKPLGSDAGEDKVVTHSSFWENVKTIGIALLIALVIRAFFFQPFNIPSGSMRNTLLEGDYLFVSKFAYGYSKHSLPFSPPLFSGRAFGSAPERGDVVVFKTPRDNRTDYIKRVIGMPGDQVQMIDGVLHINGQAVERHPIDSFVERDKYGNVYRIPRYREILPNGVSYDTLDSDPDSPADNTNVFTVPAGHYFMMGDNRDNSADSRDMSKRGVGFVPAENLVGRAEVLFFSHDSSAAFWEVWKWPSAIRWSRLFSGIR